MTNHESQMPEQPHRHFLFHIFRLDKAENPMPENKAASLLCLIKSNFTNITIDKENA